MRNGTNSVKNLAEDYEELKQLIMNEVTWNGVKKNIRIRIQDWHSLYEARGRSDGGRCSAGSDAVRNGQKARSPGNLAA